VRFGGREYSIAVDFRITSLAPRGHGVQLAPLVPGLESFPNKRAWSAYLRRALVPLTARDARKFATALAPVARAYAQAAPSYAL
jgi:hypothetical protein